MSESDVASTARPTSFVPSTAASIGPIFFCFHEAEDVLQHDHGVVDDDPDRQREREQRDDVEGEVLVLIVAKVAMIELGDGHRGDDRGRERDVWSRMPNATSSPASRIGWMGTTPPFGTSAAMAESNRGAADAVGERKLFPRCPPTD